MKSCNILCLIFAMVLCALAVSSCSKSKEDDVAQIQALEKRSVDAFTAKDVNATMAVYVPDESLIAYDSTPPRQFVGANAYRKDYEDIFAHYIGPIHAELIDFKIHAEGNLGYGIGLFHVVGTSKEGKTDDLTMRVTDVYRKINGKWLIVHEHASFPVDVATGKADLTSKP